MAQGRSDDDQPRPVDLRRPARPAGRALLAILAALAGVKLWPLCLLVLLAVLVAVPLHPVATWLGRRGLPHWVAVALVAFALVLLIGGFVLLVVPPLIDQA